MAIGLVSSWLTYSLARCGLPDVSFIALSGRGRSEVLSLTFLGAGRIAAARRWRQVAADRGFAVGLVPAVARGRVIGITLFVARSPDFLWSSAPWLSAVGLVEGLERASRQISGSSSSPSRSFPGWSAVAVASIRFIPPLGGHAR